MNAVNFLKQIGCESHILFASCVSYCWLFQCKDTSEGFGTQYIGASKRLKIVPPFLFIQSSWIANWFWIDSDFPKIGIWIKSNRIMRFTPMKSFKNEVLNS